MTKKSGGLAIQTTKKYINQSSIADAIREKTGCSHTEVTKILNSLGEVVIEKFSGAEDSVELKIFPGLKVSSKHIPSAQSVSRRLGIESDFSIFMSAVFTDDFRKKVRRSCGGGLLYKGR